MRSSRCECAGIVVRWRAPTGRWCTTPGLRRIAGQHLRRRRRGGMQTANLVRARCGKASDFCPVSARISPRVDAGDDANPHAAGFSAKEVQQRLGGFARALLHDPVPCIRQHDRRETLVATSSTLRSQVPRHSPCRRRSSARASSAWCARVARSRRPPAGTRRSRPTPRACDRGARRRWHRPGGRLRGIDRFASAAKLFQKCSKYAKSRPFNQRLRRRAVEPEVPDARMVVDRLPPVDAGKEGVHQHELVHLGRELRRVGVRNHQSDVMPHHHGRFDAELSGTSA